MKIYSSEGMRSLDQMAIQEMGIPGLLLMEKAGIEVAAEAEKMLGLPQTPGKPGGGTGGEPWKGSAVPRVLMVAGPGNNGGDGFVAARHLLNHGVEVKVWGVAEEEKIKGDPLVNLKIIQNLGLPIQFVSQEIPEEFSRDLGRSHLAIDALFGTGFTGAPKEPAASIIEMINTSPVPVLSIDLPSGLNGDTGKVEGSAIRATRTVTLGYPKAGLFLYPGAEFAGKVTVADIGLPPSLSLRVPPVGMVISRGEARALLPKRKPDAHKGECGKILAVAGSRGMSGAAFLSSLAAMRTGSGLVKVILPKSLHEDIKEKPLEIIYLLAPETSTGTLSLDAFSTIMEHLQGYDLLLIGPGLGRDLETQELVRRVLREVTSPAVIDADALFPLSLDFLSSLKGKPFVLTPHEGEMGRILHVKPQEVRENRVRVARQFTADTGLTLLLKGVSTITSSPDGEIYFNLSGNPGLATGGSGDILCGMVASLVGQSLAASPGQTLSPSLFQCAALGAFLHGLAGDLAAEKIGEHSLIASDLLDYIPKAFLAILGGDN